MSGALRRLPWLTLALAACSSTPAPTDAVVLEELPCRIEWTAPTGEPLYQVEVRRDAKGRPVRTHHSLSEVTRTLTWREDGRLERDVTTSKNGTTTIDLVWDARGLLAYEGWKESGVADARDWQWDGSTQPLPAVPPRTLPDDQMGPGMPVAGLPPLLVPFHGEARAGEHVARYDSGRLVWGRTGEGENQRETRFSYDDANRLVGLERSRGGQRIERRTWRYEASGRWMGSTMQLGPGKETKRTVEREQGRLARLTVTGGTAMIRSATLHYDCGAVP